MIGSAILLAVLAVQPAGSAGSPLSQATSQLADRRQLEDLNRRWFEAYRTKNAAMLGAILADDFAGMYGTGPARTKRQMVDGLADPKRPAPDIRSDEVAVNLFGDTAMVTGRSVTRTARDGKPIESINRYADIYMRRDGQWLAVAAHVVRLPAQP